MLFATVVAMTTQQYWLMGPSFLLAFGILCLGEGVNGIFRCGLHIYATEGVAPGPFDAAALDSAWTVKGRPR
jgi:hypothetical protein